MDALLWIFALALSALVVFYVASPLRAADSAPADAERARGREQREHNEMLRRDLRELEADRAEGKIAPRDYEALLGETTRQVDAAQETLRTMRPEPKVLKREVAPAAVAVSPRAQTTNRARLAWDAEVEIAILRARWKRAAQTLAAAWACANCGRVMGARDGFCASCGAKKP